MKNDHIFAIQIKTKGHIQDHEIGHKIFDLICKYKHEIDFDDKEGQILEMRGLSLAEKNSIVLRKD